MIFCNFSANNKERVQKDVVLERVLVAFLFLLIYVTLITRFSININNIFLLFLRYTCLQCLSSGVTVDPAMIKQGFKRAFAAPWPEKLRYQVYALPLIILLVMFCVIAQ